MRPVSGAKPGTQGAAADPHRLFGKQPVHHRTPPVRTALRAEGERRKS